VKSNLMSSRSGLTSARRSTVLHRGSQVILTVGAAAQLQQDQSVLQQGKPVQILVKAANWFAPVAFPAMRVPAIPATAGGSYAATTKHIGNGGLRGPQPWRHPPVIT
jgi:hypothetical protein